MRALVFLGMFVLLVGSASGQTTKPSDKSQPKRDVGTCRALAQKHTHFSNAASKEFVKRCMRGESMMDDPIGTSALFGKILTIRPDAEGHRVRTSRSNYAYGVCHDAYRWHDRALATLIVASAAICQTAAL